jgi:Trypsin
MRPTKNPHVFLFLVLATTVSMGCSSTAEPGEGHAEDDISNPSAAVPLFVKRSVVRLHGPNTHCSAVLIAPDRIVTAYHCIEAGGPMDAEVGTLDPSPATVIWSHSGEDLAVLSLLYSAQKPYAPATIHRFDRSALVPGMRVLIAGFGRTDDSLVRSDRDTLRVGKSVFRKYLPYYSANFTSGLEFSPDRCSKTDPACSNICTGDDGGAVFQSRPGVGWGLIGINSSASENCRGTFGSGWGAFGIAADLTAARDWALQKQ